MRILPGLAEALQKVQPIEATTVQTIEQLNLLVERLNKENIFSLDTETTGLEIPTLSLVGISIAFSKNDAVYIPVGHISLDKQLPVRVVIEALKKPLERKDKTIIFHHSKFDIGVLEKYGIKIPILFNKDFMSVHDTMVMSWILDENQVKKLKVLAPKFVNMEMGTYKSLFGGKKSKTKYAESVSDDEDDSDYDNEVLQIIDDDSTDDDPNIANVAVSAAAIYAKDDAIATLLLYYYFIERIIKEKMLKQYTYEMRLIPAMVHIHNNGVLVNSKKAELKYKEAVEEVEEMDNTIKGKLLSIPEIMDIVEARRYTQSGLRKRERETIDVKDLLKLSSNNLKRQIFYDILGLADDDTIKTKTGNYSTGKWAIQSLINKGKKEDATDNEKLGSEVCEILQKLTKKRKLVEGFFAPLANKLHDGRVYAHFNNIGTKTGRFTSNNPNLQNMPRDTKEYTFRDIFIVPEGYKWVCVDLSAIELRLAAHFSEDFNMCEVYRTGGDIHNMTTFLIYGIKPEDFPEGKENKEFYTKRTISKTFNFARPQITWRSKTRSIAGKLNQLISSQSR